MAANNRGLLLPAASAPLLICVPERPPFYGHAAICPTCSILANGDSKVGARSVHWGGGYPALHAVIEELHCRKHLAPLVAPA